MPSFSSASLDRLATCHSDLRALFHAVVQGWDCTILEGKRTETQQQKNVERGVSKTLNSKHVYPLDGPSHAVDVAPWPLRWPTRPRDGSAAERERYVKDVSRFYYFAGYVLGIAAQMGIDIGHGGDWDSDRDIHDQSFDDLVHFELRS